ncbi:hypothetical protein EDB86DRAFT_2243145 [Lactarius hatsudake]|nr:hypothetical protein EDB86DRAFT_2243145 [Lactarius hatsudake]
MSLLAVSSTHAFKDAATDTKFFATPQFENNVFYRSTVKETYVTPKLMRAMWHRPYGLDDITSGSNPGCNTTSLQVGDVGRLLVPWVGMLDFAKLEELINDQLRNSSTSRIPVHMDTAAAMLQGQTVLLKPQFCRPYVLHHLHCCIFSTADWNLQECPPRSRRSAQETSDIRLLCYVFRFYAFRVSISVS